MTQTLAIMAHDAINNEDPSKLKRLLDRGLSPDEMVPIGPLTVAKEGRQWPLLSVALNEVASIRKKAAIECVKLLIEAGANINTEYRRVPAARRDMSPLTKAISTDNTAAINAVLKSRHNIDWDIPAHQDLACWAVVPENNYHETKSEREKHDRLLRKLYKNGMPIDPKSDHLHPAFTAVKHGMVWLIDYMIEQGIDVERVNREHNVLYGACMNPILGTEETLLLWMQHGADPTFMPDHTQNTAFWHALKNNLFRAAEKMLEHGADKQKHTERSFNGKTVSIFEHAYYSEAPAGLLVKMALCGLDDPEKDRYMEDHHAQEFDAMMLKATRRQRKINEQSIGL